MLDKFRDWIDNLVDGISMYRLLIYYLVGLLIAATVMSFAGIMKLSGIDIAISAAILVFSCYVINKILAAIFRAPANPESSLLTGLILALIISPAPSGTGLLFILAASGLAMASKYILTIKHKHLFNPAAIAVVLTAIGPKQSASWWVGTAAMLPFVIAGGIFIVRKVRRENMVGWFLGSTTVATVLFAMVSGTSVSATLKNMILYSAVFFLGFVMLTEPYTSPTTRVKQIWYAIIVGVVMAPQFHIGNYYPTPEVALIVGNIFAYIVSSKTKLFPALFRKYKIAKDSAEFEFVPDRPLKYLPGQYMEFTLPHDATDSRGARRYFTLSSSPTEDNIKIGVKFYNDGSSYKSALLDIDTNTPIVAAQLGGDFVLPEDPRQKLVFIAGGIGITPFRSMVKYLVDINQKRDITLIYSARKENELAYKKLFKEAAKKIGLDVHYVVTGEPGRSGTKPSINNKLINSLIPDLEERVFYISGTHEMVESTQERLHHLGVKHGNIKTDFFPGYA